LPVGRPTACPCSILASPTNQISRPTYHIGLRRPIRRDEMINPAELRSVSSFARGGDSGREAKPCRSLPTDIRSASTALSRGVVGRAWRRTSVRPASIITSPRSISAATAVCTAWSGPPAIIPRCSGVSVRRCTSRTGRRAVTTKAITQPIIAAQNPSRKMVGGMPQLGPEDIALIPPW
jgi:hypothetical protein